jgi:hypothetical protein
MSRPEQFDVLILGSSQGGNLLAWRMRGSGRRTRRCAVPRSTTPRHSDRQSQGPSPRLGRSPTTAKGLGELTAVSVAPAIANAVYHATGKRVRDLPITVEKLL